MIVKVLIAGGILGAIGFVLGAALWFAAKTFHVEQDDRIDKITACLPGANCGGCGYAGCAGYAAAMVNDGAKLDLCGVCDSEGVSKISEILGVEAVSHERKTAFVRCRGGNEVANKKYVYHGMADCIAEARLLDGHMSCKYGCIGFGTCTTACKYDAIHIVDGIAKVDREKCVGCMACAKVCPRDLIVPVDYNHYTVIACASKARGATTIRGCSSGCIGCGQCVKACPYDAIRVEDNLAIIDYSKCTSCGLCAIICPQQMIASPVKTTPELSQLVKAALKK